MIADELDPVMPPATSRRGIEARLVRAKLLFLRNDIDLLSINVNERAVTARFAHYLQLEFPDWNVDAEYNRDGDTEKRLRLIGDTEDLLVIPDIIIHQRRTRDNLLAIEAKKRGEYDDFDRRKVQAFTTDERFRYKYGAILTLEVGSTPDIRIELSF